MHVCCLIVLLNKLLNYIFSNKQYEPHIFQKTKLIKR